ncbi:MAG: helix-turn-helix transcriptional regulator [Chitinophagaceae bacterium]|nr:helix-turn-helix transcriptional regulator [Chitinophagaceae bacterium]
MFLGKRIKQTREEKGFLQRQLAASLEMDTPMFSKIERGERKAKREQVLQLAKLLAAPGEELLTLWLAGKVYELVKDEDVALKAVQVAEEELKTKKRKR